MAMISNEQKWNIRNLSYQAFGFAFCAGYTPLVLFLPLYLKQLGLSTFQTGLLCGLRPVIQSIGAPILLRVGEKLRARKLLFAISAIIVIGKFFLVFVVLRPGVMFCSSSVENKTTKNLYAIHNLKKRHIKFMDDLFPPRKHSEIHSLSNGESKSRKNVEIFKSRRLIGRRYPVAPQRRESFFKSHPLRKEERTGFEEALLTPLKLKTTKDVEGKNGIDNDAEVDRIFMILLALSLLGDTFDAVVLALVDDIYKPKSCGKNAPIWSNIAGGLMTLIAGLIIDKSASDICGQIARPYHYVFYFIVVFTLIAMSIGLDLDFEANLLEAGVSRKIQTVKSNFEYNVYILAFMFVGFYNGFLFSFVFWFLDTLGGSSIIMGMAAASGCLVNFFVNFKLEEIVNFIGHMSAICVGFCGFILVFLIYYAIKNPWLVILANGFQALILEVMMYSCSSFLMDAAPAGSSYQMQANIHRVYSALGMAVGAIFGGFSIQRFRFRKTFLCFALITCIMSFIFLAVWLFTIFSEGKWPSTASSECTSSDDSQYADDEGDMEAPGASP